MSWYNPVSGNGSMVVNGQIVPVPMTGQFFPSFASAPFYKGNGQGPPTVPINTSASGSDMQAAQVASNNPFSFTLSPLIIAALALVIGILGLRYVHWR